MPRKSLSRPRLYPARCDPPKEGLKPQPAPQSGAGVFCVELDTRVFIA